MHSLIRTLSAVAALTAVLAPLAQSQGADAVAKAAIRRDIDIYTRSIDAADPKLGGTIWLTTPDASFINPVGHERGWDQIVSDVYVRLMGQTFSKRHLSPVTEPVIHVYGNAAVAEFDWIS